MARGSFARRALDRPIASPKAARHPRTPNDNPSFEGTQPASNVRVGIIVSLSADDWVVDYDNFVCSYE
jgi:hypothetical protein